MQDQGVEARAPATIGDEDYKKFVSFVRKLKGLSNDVETYRRRPLARTEDAADNPGASSLVTAMNYWETVNAALEQVTSFLESPLGETAVGVLKNYYDEIWDLAINFTQVAAGVIVANLFLDIADELLLKVREDEFESARKKVESSIKFVNATLPKIANCADVAGSLLKNIRTSDLKAEDMEKLITDFKETIRLAKFYISECDIRLKSADVKIEEAMNKIAVHMKANGMIRGALVTAGGFGIYYLYRDKTINLPTAVTMGFAGLLLLFTRLRPRYQQELKDFLKYKSTQEDLHTELESLNKLLKFHEDSFNANLPK